MFDYVENYKIESEMIMFGVDKNNVEYFERFERRMENEAHLFYWVIQNNDELLKEELLEELYKSLDYLFEVRNNLDSNENYKIKKFYDEWITKFEKSIDNTKELIRLRKYRSCK